MRITKLPFIKHAIRIMNKLPFVRKFILVSICFALPLIILGTALFLEINKKVSISEEELEGLNAIEGVYDLLFLSHQYRDIRMVQRASSNADIVKEVERVTNQMDDTIVAISQTPYLLSHSDLKEQTNKLRTDWNKMKFSSAGAAGGPNIQFQFYNGIVKDVELLLKNIAYTSKLIHDPALSTFLLVDLIINKVPNTLNHLGFTRGYGSYALSIKAIDYQTFKTFDKIYDDLLVSQKVLSQNLQFILKEDSSQSLSHVFQDISNQAEQASNYFYKNLIEKDFITEEWDNYFKVISQSFTGIETDTKEIIPIIQNKIQQRIRVEMLKLWGIGLGTLVLTLVIFYLYAGMYISIALVSKNFIQKAEQVAAGDLSVHLNVRSNDELSQLYIAFNEMVKQLKENQEQILQAEKMASLGSMIAGVAHELNTPLGIGRTAVSKLKEDLDKMDAYYQDGIIKRSDLEEYLKYGQEGLSLIEANMQRCAKLINSFKQLSVAQTHVSQETIDIIPIIKNVISPTGILNISPSVSIRLDADEEVMVNVDPDLLSLILVNVISNILQHAFPQETGNIFITVEKANGKLYLDIADDGIGISDEHIEQIFEPFYTTRRHQGYVGLGLHIVYVILTQALHGSIRVESSPNNGAHFKIELAEFNPYCIQKNESIEKNEQ